MERNWTEVGEELVERLGGREAVEAGIGELEYHEIPEGGSLTVGFMPGEGINAAIRELRLPRVSRIAISAFERPAASPEEDGFYPGFYAIECSYGNGLCRVYVLDTGTGLTPVASDFFASDGGEVEQVTKAGTELWRQVEAVNV